MVFEPPFSGDAWGDFLDGAEVYKINIFWKH